MRGARLALASGAVICALTLLLCNEDALTGMARFGLNVTALETGGRVSPATANPLEPLRSTIET